jgi:[FeFe] hydrogenase H-cluster maturation GTPase HydF
MSKGRDEKPHIGIFGKRNNGKSSFINIIVNQEIAIVSGKAGTTTDPVKKSIEIFDVGPAIIIDTAGIDDYGELGKKRVDKTLQIVKIIDLAILLITNNDFAQYEKKLIKEFNKYSVPYFIVHNKSDLENLKKETINKIKTYTKSEIIDFSTIKPDNIEDVIELIKKTIPETAYHTSTLIGNLISKGDIVMLITPIDSETPEGRLILPEVMVIRDILDNNCTAIVLKENEIVDFLKKTKLKPKLAITDSQVFEKSNAFIPNDIPLTSFSIVLAHYKGDFQNYLKGTPKLSELKDGDRILILESCTHYVSCDDIGRTKIPNWVRKFSGKKLNFDVVSGLSELPRNINDYAMVIQCGGCVLTKKQIVNRLKPAVDSCVPVTNYGMTISYIHGVYERAIYPFVNC